MVSEQMQFIRIVWKHEEKCRQYLRTGEVTGKCLSFRKMPEKYEGHKMPAFQENTEK